MAEKPDGSTRDIICHSNLLQKDLGRHRGKNTSNNLSPVSDANTATCLWVRQHARYSGDIWQCSFISTVRFTVHTNPLRKRRFSRTNFKPAEFENAGFSFSCGRAHIFKTKLSRTGWLRNNQMVFLKHTESKMLRLEISPNKYSSIFLNSNGGYCVYYCVYYLSKITIWIYYPVLAGTYPVTRRVLTSRVRVKIFDGLQLLIFVF